MRRFPPNNRAIKAKIKIPEKKKKQKNKQKKKQKKKTKHGNSLNTNKKKKKLIETLALKVTPREKNEFEVIHILVKTDVWNHFKNKQTNKQTNIDLEQFFKV